MGRAVSVPEGLLACWPGIGFAEVSLHFDNSGRVLPVDLDEVSITRRLYRNGDSDYETNDEPDGNDDDVVARQLREAAMREPDPAVREKLWDEYRKYKGIAE